MDQATTVKEGRDLLIVACGEMVRPAAQAAEILEREGISVAVLDMYCLKPFDTETLRQAAKDCKAVISVEEHAPFGGLGSMVSQVIAKYDPKKVWNMTLPDEPVVTGTSQEVFDYYGLNAEGIAEKGREILK